MFDYQSIAYYFRVLNHKLNTYSNWRIKIWSLHTLNKSNIKVHESFKKVCILIVQMLLFSARTKTKQSKVGTIKNPANLEKKASTQWAVSSPLADLSFHIPVLFYNDIWTELTRLKCKWTRTRTRTRGHKTHQCTRSLIEIVFPIPKYLFLSYLV